MRRWWSGLSQESVKLPPSGFVGSNPTRRTILKNSSFCLDFLIYVSPRVPTLRSERVGFEDLFHMSVLTNGKGVLNL